MKITVYRIGPVREADAGPNENLAENHLIAVFDTEKDGEILNVCIEVGGSSFYIGRSYENDIEGIEITSEDKEVHIGSGRVIVEG